MALVPLNDILKKEYNDLFNSCNITAGKSAIVEGIISKIKANKGRYESVGTLLNIPWYFIGVIHNMESSLNFSRHLHNGDPLTAKTTHVPAGRPLTGNPPYSWEASAADALQMQKLHQWTDWSVPGMLYKLEEYNGWGYRRKHPHVLSPYLWSFSNHYSKGKYVADGTWSDTAVSNQCGGAILLRRMSETNDITPGANVGSGTPSPQVTGPVLKYSKSKIPYGEELQSFLNKFPGIFVKVDGAPGEKTSDAFKKIFGYYLKGDLRE